MITAVRVELLKWKRTKIPILVLLSTLIIPLINFITMYSLKGKDYFKPPTWEQLFGKILFQEHVMVFPVVFGCFIGYVFVREFQEKGHVNLFTMPISRITIVTSKMIIVFVVLFFGIILSSGFSILLGKIFVNEPLSMKMMQNFFSVSVQALVMQFMLMPIVVVVGLFSRHYVPTLGTAILFIIANFFGLFFGKNGSIIPTLIPAVFIKKQMFPHPEEVCIPYVWSILLFIFLFSLILISIILKRKEFY